MTGIERLREFVAGISPFTVVCGVASTSYDGDRKEEVGVLLRDFLADIADRIEREQGGRVSRMRVLAVVTEMERHVSGVEGTDDSPVARWARELREALGDNGRDHAADVPVSAYDLLTKEERNALAWVREHGGVDELTRMFQDADSRRVELCGALGIDLDKGWSEAMAAMRLRLMPEGMEWPRYEDDEPVRIGDVVSDVEVRSVVFRDGGILLSDCTSVPGWGTWRSYKEPIKRDPAEDVSVSAYDLLPADERATIAWVREHGGLDAVERRWECLSYYADPVPRSCMEKRLARLQRQIDECHEALRRRNQRIAVLASEINRAHSENRMEFLRRAGDYAAFADEVFKRLAPQLRHVEGCTKDVMDAALDALDRRLVPESIEWPRFESGELVNLGDRYECWCGKTHVVSSVSVRKGCSVLNASDEAHTFVVSDGPLTSHGKRVRLAAVPAADGEPLEVGQTVWDTDAEADTPLTVVEVSSDLVRCEYAWKDGKTYRPCYPPDQLTHTKPEPIDIWQRIEEDA